MRHDGRRRGLTLLECLIAIALLAACVIALTVPFQASADIELEDARRTLATSLATEMMEEILAKDFDDLAGSDSGTSWAGLKRSGFDSMNDYHGYAEPAGSVCDIHGVAMDDPASQGLSREVTVAYVYLPGQDTSQPQNFAWIQVVVARDGDPLQTLTRLAYQNR